MNDTERLLNLWQENTLASEWSFHQLSPYIGKVKSSLAKGLIRQFTERGDVVMDPYCGCGTVPFECWSNGRQVIANDLSPYAFLLTMGKLFPISDLGTAVQKLSFYHSQMLEKSVSYDLRRVPKWVRSFYHPKTLKEILAWVEILKTNNEWFLLSCLMGILHHQRPGFLSYPSSHAVPYLRQKKFPFSKFPGMYEYRPVFERLQKKVGRAFKNAPSIDRSLNRICYQLDVREIPKAHEISAVITSPPYMRQLEYGRDNRLRLWFLGCDNWEKLDKSVSPREECFITTIRQNLQDWKIMIKKNGFCILILGDSMCRTYKMNLPDTIQTIAVDEVGGFKMIAKIHNQIPEKKRVRKHVKGSTQETILILKKT